jgi:cytochrome P450
MIEGFRGKGEVEFMEAFGRRFPVTVILSLMGLPLEELPKFLQWEDELLHKPDVAVKVRAARQIKDYLLEAIEDRRRSPRDDLFTKAVQHQIKGEPLSDDEVLGFCYLMFVGGLDTVAASLGFHYKHLAEHPELQEQLRREPALIPSAAEELLRRFGLVTSARRALEDTEIAGVKIKAGDWISISLPFAAIDPHEYPDPLTVDFKRPSKSHLTFAYGAHVCLGMHLARRELIIALEEWTQRMPVFRIKPGTRPLVHAGGVFGVDELQLVWDV